MLYTANYPHLNLYHLEQRMRQTGDWKGNAPLGAEPLRELLTKAVDDLDVDQARKEMEPFVRRPENLAIWSRDFFLDVASRVRFV